MKYPFKSNWISYKVIDGTDNYLVKNHLSDKEYVVNAAIVELINNLDGKTNPLCLMLSEGMTRNEANILISRLKDEGFIRSSKRYPLRLGMQSLILVNDSFKYKKISSVLLFLQLLVFFPSVYLIVSCLKTSLRRMYFYSNNILEVWVGIALGILIGLVFHELSHAISCIAFTPAEEKSVLEFGLYYKGFPGAYTLMDTNLMSKIGRIITCLAGVVANFIIAAIFFCFSLVSSEFVTLFFCIGICNLELGLVNCLFVKTLDGRQAIDEILGNYKNICSYSRRKDKRYSNDDRRLALYTSRLFVIMQIIYPALVVFNIAIILGW